MLSTQSRHKYTAVQLAAPVHTHCLTVLCEEDECPQGHSLHSLVPLMGREGAGQQVHHTLLHYGLQQQLCKQLGQGGRYM